MAGLPAFGTVAGFADSVFSVSSGFSSFFSSNLMMLPSASLISDTFLTVARTLSSDSPVITNISNQDRISHLLYPVPKESI